MKCLFKSALLTCVVLSLFACGKGNNKASNIDPRTGKHPAGWAVANIGGNHPVAFLSVPSSCYECHGKDLKGGISAVSCFSTSRSGITCHAGGPSGHPAGWTAPDVHGKAAKSISAGMNGYAHCQVCHGTDFSGGIAKKSCLNTDGCHGSGIVAAHSAKPWRDVGRTGARSHASTDSSNVAACAVCHTKGANSTRTPSPAAAAGTAPGCFNNTLCHGVEGHATGWESYSSHGRAAKAAVGGITIKGVLSPISSFGSCVECHGAAYDGGAALQTCLNTAGCHGATVAAPHPAKPWRSSAGGVTHTSTDTSNAVQCAVCHTAGANSTRVPRAGDAVGITNCFNNTLCHGVEGHVAGWSAAAQHGAAAKGAPAANSGFSACQFCHGSTFNNGTPPSCTNVLGCHGLFVSSPHPAKPWSSRVAGASTHTDTDQANAGICAACHTGGANSTVVPPNPAAGTAGCYNNTLCHFHTIPFAPPAVAPTVHGGLAKQDLRVCQTCHGVKGTTSFNGLALAGGVTTIACSSCHTFAKAHATDWQGSGAYTHRTAGSVANACTLCHDVTLGRTAPLPAAPSCFSSTFTNGLVQTRTCHASGPGVAPHSVPYNNHIAVAGGPSGNTTYCLGCHQINVDVTTAGGKLIPRCLTCHYSDPTVSGLVQCTSCHANPPAGATYPNIAGTHSPHISASKVTVMVLVCADCHTGLGLTTVNHQVRAKARTASVQGSPVVFSGNALIVAGGGTAPAFTSGANGQCTNVYCHGAKMSGGDTTGTSRTPTWGTTLLTSTISAAACGTCHGFPPAVASGHPAVTLPAGFPATPLGSTCSCHSNINTQTAAAATYANVFVDLTKHINGTLEVSGGHGGAPYDAHNAAVVAAGGNTACLACHAMGTAASPYPAAVVGNPPDCMSCHKKAAPVHTGTGVGANCSSCHGLSTATTTRIGRPNTSNGTFPDNQKNHSRSDHIVACTVCHVLGASGGTGSGVNHGRGSTAGPVRDGKQGVVGPFTTGITPGAISKGASPSVTCNHNATLGGGCGNGQGNQTW